MLIPELWKQIQWNGLFQLQIKWSTEKLLPTNAKHKKSRSFFVNRITNFKCDSFETFTWLRIFLFSLVISMKIPYEYIFSNSGIPILFQSIQAAKDGQNRPFWIFRSYIFSNTWRDRTFLLVDSHSVRHFRSESQNKIKPEIYRISRIIHNINYRTESNLTPFFSFFSAN